MVKNIASVIKWIAILLLVLSLAFAVYAAVKINRAASTTSMPQDFEIKKGEHAGAVADRLAAQKLVLSELLLELYLRFKDAEDKLQAGVYILDSNMTIPEIVQILSQGKVKASGLRLTVIEGWSVSDISTRLENLGIMQAKQFGEVVGFPRADYLRTAEKPHDFSGEFAILKTKPARYGLEGFLFPDTYIVKQDTTGEDIARKMLANFSKKVTQDMIADIEKQKRNFYDVLILASIIEREVGRNFKTGTKLTAEQVAALAQERRIVSGIFMNRMKLGMALESDATVNYITGKKTPRASFDDLKLDSPYNTYKYRGLPPTPISNPSLDSIMAAVRPADTDYLFFLTGEDGTAYFAKTLSEHAANRAKYLK